MFLSVTKWVDRSDSGELELGPSFICQDCGGRNLALLKEWSGSALCFWEVIFVIHDWSVFIQGERGHARKINRVIYGVVLSHMLSFY